MTSAAFKVAPSTIVSYANYDRSTPLKADTVEFDLTGEFDVTNYAFKAATAKTMCFHFNMLWQAVPDEAYMTACLFLSTDGGATWTEICGTDSGTSIYPGSPTNQGMVVSRLYNMNAGDMIRAHPCNAFGASGGTLCNSFNTGIATCNYFEGFQIGI